MSEFTPGLPGDFRNQRYRDYQRQRQYQTNDILLENRIIFFGCTAAPSTPRRSTTSPPTS